MWSYEIVMNLYTFQDWRIVFFDSSDDFFTRSYRVTVKGFHLIIMMYAIKGQPFGVRVTRLMRKIANYYVSGIIE